MTRKMHPSHVGRTAQKRDILAGRIRSDMTFMQQVWAVCARVPRGQVTTYGEVARALGKPNAARAVGMAMNRNPYAPDVPCHRVVGHNGKLVGFAHGLDRKRQLLLAEGVRFIKQRTPSASQSDRVDPACIVSSNKLCACEPSSVDGRSAQAFSLSVG